MPHLWQPYLTIVAGGLTGLGDEGCLGAGSVIFVLNGPSRLGVRPRLNGAPLDSLLATFSGF